MVSGYPQSEQICKKLNGLIARKSCQVNPPPWHKDLFSLLDARVANEGADGPIFVLVTGKAYWENRTFITAAAAHGNYVPRNDRHWCCMVTPFTQKFYDDRPGIKTVAEVEQAVQAELQHLQAQPQPPALQPAAAAAALYPMHELLQQLEHQQQLREQLQLGALPNPVPVPVQAVAGAPAAAAGPLLGQAAAPA
jgi:hypothetical protein